MLILWFLHIIVTQGRFARTTLKRFNFSEIILSFFWFTSTYCVRPEIEQLVFWVKQKQFDKFIFIAVISTNTLELFGEETDGGYRLRCGRLICTKKDELKRAGKMVCQEITIITIMIIKCRNPATTWFLMYLSLSPWSRALLELYGVV